MKDFYSFAHTVIGHSHIAENKVCQDYSLSMDRDDAVVIVVSDGHGSPNFTRSHRGSQYACEVVLEAAEAFLRTVEDKMADAANRDETVAQLCKHILLRWNMCVDADVAAEPFTQEELEKVSQKYKERYEKGKDMEHAYGCTLIFVIMTPKFCLAVRNGDGQCVMVDSTGIFTTPIPWNENCEFNVTTSLCDPSAIDNFRYFYSETLPAAIFIGSDGVDDSYASEEELFNLYRNLCVYAVKHGEEAASDYMKQLLPEITKRGSTDDVSVACCMNMDMLQGVQTSIELALMSYQEILAQKRLEQQKGNLIRAYKTIQKKYDKAMAQYESVRWQLELQNSDWLFSGMTWFGKKKQNAECSSADLTQEANYWAAAAEDLEDKLKKISSQLETLQKKTDTPVPEAAPEMPASAEGPETAAEPAGETILLPASDPVNRNVIFPVEPPETTEPDTPVAEPAGDAETADRVDDDLQPAEQTEEPNQNIAPVSDLDESGTVNQQETNEQHTAEAAPVGYGGVQDSE